MSRPLRGQDVLDLPPKTWIDAQRHDFGLDEMCAVLDVSEGG